MKAFVSYSVTDNNEFILTLLAAKLREKNFVVTTSQNFYSQVIDYHTTSEIRTSNLFVGIITGIGNERKRVLEEWNYAVQQSVPNLLLIEDTVPVHEQFKGNYLRFNRKQPQATIDEINRRMTVSQATTAKNTDDIVAWLLGGAALLAIIGLLARDNK
jgi:hypothetical protein